MPRAPWNYQPEPPQPRSALTLRLVLATFGLMACSAGAILFAVLDLPPVLVALALLFAGIAVIDLIVITTHKHHDQPG